MKTIVTEISEGIAYYPELDNWVRSFDLDPDDELFEPLYLMEGDPDIIRCDGRKMYFMCIERDGTQFIITSEEVGEKERQMLIEFHQDDFQNTYSIGECSWEAFNKAENAVAFRGGKGYVYTIWLYNNLKTN